MDIPVSIIENGVSLQSNQRASQTIVFLFIVGSYKT